MPADVSPADLTDDPTPVTSDPAVMLGKPCVAGTRITVEAILGKLAHGRSFEEILAAYPHLTRAQLGAAVGFAAGVLRGVALDGGQQAGRATDSLADLADSGDAVAAAEARGADWCRSQVMAEEVRAAREAGRVLWDRAAALRRPLEEAERAAAALVETAPVPAAPVTTVPVAHGSTAAVTPVSDLAP